MNCPSFKVIPPLGRAVTGDADSIQYLVEIDPEVSQAQSLPEMIRAAGFSRVKWESLSGGIVALHSGLAFVMLCDRPHIGAAWFAPLTVFRSAKGVFGVVDPSLVPPPGQLASDWRGSSSGRGDKSGPRSRRARTSGSDRPISSFGQFFLCNAGPTWSASPWAQDLRKLAGPACRRLAERGRGRQSQPRWTPCGRRPFAGGGVVGSGAGAGGCRRLDRASGIAARSAARRVAQIGCTESNCAPTWAARFPPATIADFFFVAHNAEAHSATRAGLRLDRGHQHQCRARRDREWICGWLAAGECPENGGEYA